MHHWLRGMDAPAAMQLNAKVIRYPDIKAFTLKFIIKAIQIE